MARGTEAGTGETLIVDYWALSDGRACYRKTRGLVHPNVRHQQRQQRHGNHPCRSQPLQYAGNLAKHTTGFVIIWQAPSQKNKLAVPLARN